MGARERALAGAILLFIINLIGLGGGPSVTGAISDAVRASLAAGGMDATVASAQGLRYPLCLMVCVNLWSALHCVFAARSLREDLAIAEARQGAAPLALGVRRQINEFGRCRWFSQKRPNPCARLAPELRETCRPEAYDPHGPIYCHEHGNRVTY